MQINTRIYGRFCSGSGIRLPQVIIREVDEEPKKGFNLPVLAASTAGTILPLLLIAKLKGGSVLKFKPKFKFMDLQLGPKEFLAVAAGSILGGLLGGVIKDKGKHTRKKIKEANQQFFANIAAPMLLVPQLNKLAKKLLSEEKVGKFWSKAGVVGSTVLGIAGGYTIGTAAVKFINKMFISRNPEAKRKIQAKDLIYQVDDVTTAIVSSKSANAAEAASTATAAAANIPFITPALKILEKAVPFFFIISGYQTGNK